MSSVDSSLEAKSELEEKIPEVQINEQQEVNLIETEIIQQQRPDTIIEKPLVEEIEPMLVVEQVKIQENVKEEVGGGKEEVKLQEEVDKKERMAFSEAIAEQISAVIMEKLEDNSFNSGNQALPNIAPILGKFPSSLLTMLKNNVDFKAAFGSKEKKEVKEEPIVESKRFVRCLVGYGEIDSISDSIAKIKLLKWPEGCFCYAPENSLCYEINVNVFCFRGDVHLQNVNLKINLTMDEVLKQLHNLFSDSHGYNSIFYNGVQVSNSLSLAELNIQPNSSILLTAKAFRSFIFDTSFCGDYIYISNDYLTCGIDQCVSRWYTCRGKESYQLSSGTYRWQVRVDSTYTGFVAIGICNDSQNRNSWIGSDVNGLGYLGTGMLWKSGKCSNFGEPFRTGDVISVTLDLLRKEVTFTKNGRNMGTVSVEMSGPIYAAFSFYSAFDRITIAPNISSYPYADRSNVVTMKTYKSNRVDIDISRESCSSFPFLPGDKVFDTGLNMVGVVVGVGLAPERFKNYMFVYHEARPGVGGWSANDIGSRLEIREKADKNIPVRTILASVLADPGSTWDVKEVAQFNQLLDESEDNEDAHNDNDE